jgi:Uma2 family endonuclease
MITDFNQLDLNKRYSYADYLTWMFDDRVELFKGWVKKMSPAPNRGHQRISWQMTIEIGTYLKDKPCAAFSAPFDVRLIGKLKSKKVKEDDSIYTVVQPDICVICDESKLDDRGCLGAPDWIIEIVSPGNTKKEVDDKFEIYEENGVREYWIVQPTDETVTVFDLNNNKYRFRKIYNNVDKAPVGIFTDFVVNLSEVFKK